jgi:hypothetical protein
MERINTETRLDDDIRPEPWRISKLSLLQKGHVTPAAQRTQRAMDGNLCVLGVSAVRFCSGVKHGKAHRTQPML